VILRMSLLRLTISLPTSWTLNRTAGRSKEKPLLMLMDNHESHSSLAAIDIARASGVVILTLSPQPPIKCNRWIAVFMDS